MKERQTRRQVMMERKAQLAKNEDTGFWNTLYGRAKKFFKL